jgi:hypothetical protein
LANFNKTCRKASLGKKGFKSIEMEEHALFKRGKNAKI